MTVYAVVTDLIFSARIVDAAQRAGVDLRVVSEPSALPAPDEADLVLVDWNDRRPGWAELLEEWRSRASTAPRLVLFGSHTDIDAHREAKALRIGPVMARSAFVGKLAALLAGDA